MSAYISNPETFGLLAAYAVLKECVIGDWVNSRQRTLEARINNAQRVAKGLAYENIRSVCHRYPDSTDGDRPGPNLKDADIEEAAALYAAHFVTNAPYVKGLQPVTILKLSQGVDYQSCETEDWKDTLAWRQLNWINSEAIRSLPGYDESDWSFTRPIPEIEALYERSPDV